MITSILGFLGIKKITTPLIFAGVVLFGAAAAAAWMRDDAIQDCNMKWELRLTAETLALKTRAAEAQAAVDALATKLANTEAQLKEKHDAEKESLAHQKADFPLSADCAKCRVPNERIWLRPSSGTSKQSVPKGKPTS